MKLRDHAWSEEEATSQGVARFDRRRAADDHLSRRALCVLCANGHFDVRPYGVGGCDFN